MSPTRQQRRRVPPTLDEWARNPGLVVTRGEVLELLAMEEARRDAQVRELADRVAHLETLCIPAP